MSVRQLSVFMENKAGRLADITAAVATAGSNIRGFVVSDTAEFGIIRFVLSRFDEGVAALRNAGFTTAESEVIVIDLSEDRPGRLAAVLRELSDVGVNVEYAYSLVDRLLAISVADANSAEKLIAQRNIRVLSQADIDSL
ncbi:MAG: ACT domain-containing protein [Actinomycetes bacterium]|jgi:hypothetical protein|nr:ACT domain-containing protein [Actinomycetes bacterium]